VAPLISDRLRSEFTAQIFKQSSHRQYLPHAFAKPKPNVV
jgi:hypothetical protein